jgi:hypothetical protein
VRPELDNTLEAPTAPSADRTVTKAGTAPLPSITGGIPAGKQLGHFRIERPLGAGGMGEVYLATDLALDRPVAIKVLPEELARDPKRRDRMIREARAQARVAHPNVGHMYFIGEEVDRLYFAMEYVAGETLADRIAKGPMSVDNALTVIRSAALGLREAQRNGFTHRDVKPSNLMIDGHGMVKVLDFGLAAGDAGAIGASGPIAQTSLAGTPLYMAPEQARGEAVDFRADIYALGATLFHLIAGKPPFGADSIDELASLHATAARPPLPRRGQPRTQIGAIDALCTRMMAARPADRFASYDDLLRAIELASLTHTRPAGFWARGVALAIDFIVLGILVGVTEAISRGFDTDGLNIPMGLSLPVFVVYYALTIARWGSTLGMGLIELQVVDIDTAKPPRLTRSLKRALAMFAVTSVASLLVYVFGLMNYELAKFVSATATWLSMLIGPILLLYASARVSGKRAPWDRFAGTMVRYRTARATPL